MARPFRSADARHIVKEHINLLKRLDAVQNTAQQYREEIKKYSEALVACQSLSLLQEIPIEEINRDKRGFRVKALKDSGYNTIADVLLASVASLAAVNGISEDGALTIKKLARDLAEKAQRGAKLRLSADDRSKEASDLIYAISGYRRIRPAAVECKTLADANRRSINAAVSDARPGTGDIRWPFATHAKRQRATDAYNALLTMKAGEDYRRAVEILSFLDQKAGSTKLDAWQEFTQNPIYFTNVLEEVNPGILGNDDAMYGLPEDLAKEIEEQPLFLDGLKCELRKYQEWGVKYILHQKKALLGDEMGLGKTVQAIAAMVSLRNSGGTHFAVVCPASVLTNWCREIQRMSALIVTKVHGEDKETALFNWMQKGGVAVTTYETTASFALPENFGFTLLVVDEAHYIKNPEAHRSVNVKNLSKHSDRLLFMTGTALENKVEEMVSLISLLQPAVARQTQGMEALASAPQFRQLVAPVYYRRRREDVLTELPELIESREWCTMTPQETVLYEKAILSGNYAEARRVSWNMDDLQYSSKAERLREIVEEAESEGRKIIVFSLFLDTIQKVARLLGARCMEAINGSVTPQRRQEIIDAFDKAPAGAVLPAQIQSGGTGLNIQTASVVVLCEPQFKPSIENQAISRAYRMGQTRNVLVYRLLCDDTVDEKILLLLESKQQIFDAFADESDVAKETFELDDNTFGQIMKEEADRISAKAQAGTSGAEG